MVDPLLADDATLGSQAWWPDGRSILYTTDGEGYKIDEEGVGTGPTLLWRLDLESGEKQLVAREDGDRVLHGATPSPTGKYLAYLDGRHWKVLDVATGRARQVTESFGAREAEWSPDGEWLVFARFARNDAEGRWAPDMPGLWLWPVGGGEAAKIVPYREDLPSSADVRMCDPRWSPRARWIAFVWFTAERANGEVYAHLNEIWLARPDGSDLHQAVSIRDASPRGYAPLLGQQCWSPDGRRIVLSWTEARGGPKLTKMAQGGYHAEIESAPGGVQVLDVQTGRLTGLVPADAFPGGRWSALRPSWSPDGEHVAFIVIPDSRLGPTGDIYVASVKDGTVTPVVTTADVMGQPLWSPDGSSLLYRRRGAKERTPGSLPRSELWLVKLGYHSRQQ